MPQKQSITSAQVTLSRRAALAKGKLPLEPKQQLAFASAVTQARSFHDLPQKWKTYILKAERTKARS